MANEIAFEDYTHEREKHDKDVDKECRVGNADEFLYGEVTWTSFKHAKDKLMEAIREIIAEAVSTKAAGKRRADAPPGIYTDPSPITFIVFGDDKLDLLNKRIELDLELQFPGCEIIDLIGSTRNLWIRKKAPQKPSFRKMADAFGIPFPRPSEYENAGNNAMCGILVFFAYLVLTPDERQRILPLSSALK